MAFFTPNTLPTEPSPAYRPIYFDITSSTSDVIKIIAVLREKENDTIIASLEVEPDLDDPLDYTINLEKPLQDLVEFSLIDLDSSGQITDTTGLRTYGLEVYGVESSGSILVSNFDPDSTANAADTTFGARTVLNITKDHLGYLDFTELNMTGKWLTNAPARKDIAVGESEFLGVYINVNTNQFRVRCYDSSDAVTSTSFVPITGSNKSSTPYTGIYFDIAIGPVNLLAAGIDVSGCAYYDIQLLDGGGGGAGDVRTYDIVERCSDSVRVHWVNEFGKQDSYTFEGQKTYSTDTDSVSWTKSLGNTYVSSDRGTTTLNNIKTKTFEVFSKSEYSTTINWLEEMLLNNSAWIIEKDINDASKYVPITILDGGQLIEDTEDVVTQFRLSYTMSNIQPSIRG